MFLKTALRINQSILRDIMINFYRINKYKKTFLINVKRWKDFDVIAT